MHGLYSSMTAHLLLLHVSKLQMYAFTSAVIQDMVHDQATNLVDACFPPASCWPLSDFAMVAWKGLACYHIKDPLMKFTLCLTF